MVPTPATEPSAGGFDPATRQRLTRELAELREQRRDLAGDLVDEQPTGDSGDQSQRLERADDLARIDQRIGELTDLLAGRGTAEPSTTVAQNRLTDGTEVTLRFESGTVQDFRVVLVTEEAGDREQDRVLTVDSPLGRALADRRVGDTVTFSTPEGESTAHVLALRPPREA